MLIQGQQRDLAMQASTIIAENIDQIIAAKGQAIIGVVGGRSVAGIFQQLGQHDLPWNKTHFLLLDERLVAPDHRDSNFRLVREALGPKASAGLHSFCTAPVRPDDNLKGYNSLLARLGGTIDIALVSGGEDGHIASLFPGRNELLESGTGFILVKDAPKPPPDRMSATPSLIACASLGLLLLFGDSKQEALDNYQNPAITTFECPAKIIATLPENYLLTDLNDSLT